MDILGMQICFLNARNARIKLEHYQAQSFQRTWRESILCYWGDTFSVTKAKLWAIHKYLIGIYTINNLIGFVILLSQSSARETSARQHNQVLDTAVRQHIIPDHQVCCLDNDRAGV